MVTAGETWSTSYTVLLIMYFTKAMSEMDTLKCQPLGLAALQCNLVDCEAAL